MRRGKIVGRSWEKIVGEDRMRASLRACMPLASFTLIKNMVFLRIILYRNAAGKDNAHTP